MINSRTGKTVAVCDLKYTGIPDQVGYEIFRSPLRNDTCGDVTDITLRFTGEGKNSVKLHWFRFE